MTTITAQSADIEIPSIGDTYAKGGMRYQVVDILGSTVKLKGRYGALFNEPILKLLSSGYALKRATAIVEV